MATMAAMAAMAVVMTVVMTVALAMVVAPLVIAMVLVATLRQGNPRILNLGPPEEGKKIADTKKKQIPCEMAELCASWLPASLRAMARGKNLANLHTIRIHFRNFLAGCETFPQ